MIHGRTQRQIEQFLAHSSHAVLLVGPTGSGKNHLAEFMANKLMKLPEARSLQNQAFYQHITRQPDKQDIPVEQIRQIIDFQKLKTTGRSTIRRVVVIEDAQYLNPTSQNMLLKTLEEPPEDTVFILTVDNQYSLLPTIYSRCQKIAVLPVTKTQAQQFYGSSASDAEINSAWQLSQGRVGLMSMLLAEDDQDHPLKQAIGQAKEILSSTSYARLIQVEWLGKDRAQLLILFEAMARVAAALQASAAQKGQSATVERLQRTRQHIIKATVAFQGNSSLKLVLDDLFLNL